jgi:hypothetical protein
MPASHGRPSTIDDIVAPFRALGIPVTDDVDYVRQRYEQQKQLWLRERGSPDHVVATRAEQEEKVASGALAGAGVFSEQKLRDRIDLLKARFFDLARPMGLATDADLVQRAREIFGVDEALAERFVREYREFQHSSQGAGCLLNLRARARPRLVHLTWDRPRECDAVMVIRDEGQPSQRTLHDWSRGLRDDYKDREVEAGKTYRYSVYSFLGGHSSMQPAVVEVVVPTEPQQVSASLVVDDNTPCVEIAWKRPRGCREIVVWRRTGGAPSVTEELEPTDATTTLVHRSDDRGSTKFLDKGLAEGNTCHYLVVALFPGDDCRSEGVAKGPVLVPACPGPPKLVSSAYDGVRNEITLSWTPISGAQYVVVRGAGNAPLPEPKGRTPIPEASLTDRDLEPGEVYNCAVFTLKDGLRSRVPATAGPIAALAEVEEPGADPGDASVALFWNLPRNATGARVLRTTDPARPANSSDQKAAVVSCTDQEAQDSGLKNGMAYNYLVCCEYKMPDGTLVYSEGVRLSGIVPREPPAPLRDLVLRSEGGVVIGAYGAVGEGQVRVYPFPRKPPARCGQIVALDDLQQWGDPLPSHRPCQVEDASSQGVYYVPVTVSGRKAVVGQAKRRPIPGVEGLHTWAAPDGVRLRWSSWPEPCESVLVLRRFDTWPVGARDPDATKIEVTRDLYTQQGESVFDRLPVRHGEALDVYYAAYGVLGNEVGEPEGDANRCHVEAKRLPALELQLQQTSSEVLIRWRLDAEHDGFRGFTVLGNQAHPPLSVDDGIELAAWSPGGQGDDPQGTWRETVARIPRGIPVLHCRVFLRELDDYCRVRVKYPQQDAVLGRWPHGRTNATWGTGPRPGHRRRSRDVVCPHCFSTFPVWQMRFRYGKNDPNTGETYPLPRALWARVNPFYRMATNMPEGPDGRAFVDKMCPHCPPPWSAPRALPYTAGAQRSVMIGLLGGPQVGKTHYVVSLVRRLAALGYSPHYVDDTTNDRFTRASERLFVNRASLPPTPTLEPALIYTVEGQGGSCTLALYDTAGELLGSGEDILEKTPYLKQADGLLFLVDPRQCDVLASRLGGRPAAITADRIMTNLLNAFGRWLGQPRGGKFPIPLAVALTKADVLCEAELLPNGLLWNQPVFSEGFYDLHLHHSVDAVFGGLLSRYDKPFFGDVTEKFQDYAFFGVSATGCDADESGRFPHVVPHRVEDPLLWLLFRLGVVAGH